MGRGQLRVVTVAVNVSKEKCGDPLGIGFLSGHCTGGRGLIQALEARAALCPQLLGTGRRWMLSQHLPVPPAQLPRGTRCPRPLRLGWGPPSVTSKLKSPARDPLSVTASASSPRVAGFWKSSSPLQGALRKTFRAPKLVPLAPPFTPGKALQPLGD